MNATPAPQPKSTLAIALDHGVKLREDADLAEILAALDIDSPLPLGALEEA